ncbi:MAG TPA: hypothetical protein VNA25_08235 [Phycisphaerae bacterium]|nr:hypothetical protein [Phycisphaerae bacterium]
MIQITVIAGAAVIVGVLVELVNAHVLEDKRDQRLLRVVAIGVFVILLLATLL